MATARSKFGSKRVVFASALAVLFALVIPFSGTAVAQQPQQDESRLDLQPDADTAAVGTCNAFRVDTYNEDGTPAVGQDVLIEIVQQDNDQLRDLQIGYCDHNGQRGTPDEATGTNDCDDDANAHSACPNQPVAGAEAPARAAALCTTQADNPNTPQDEGGCTFGVYTTEPGQMFVRATWDTPHQFGDPVRFQDTSTKTWVPGGPEAVTNLDCEPEADQNPEGTLHNFTCTATNQDGVAITDVEVEARILAGPNADDPATPANEEEPIVCGQLTFDLPPPDPIFPFAASAPGESPGVTAGNTDNQGQVTCQYRDDQNDNDVGTDMIVAFVDQNNDDVIDAGEPQDEITKTWLGPGRVIDCDPETAENQAGTTHTVTCTITDREGQGLEGVNVTFTEEGVGRIEDGQNAATTDANGQATVTTSTFANETGIQEITGALDQGGAGVDVECEQPAGTPGGSEQGVCEDTVVKNWVAAPPPAACEDGLDNDGDGVIDFPADPGCVSPDDDSETRPPVEGPTTGACAGFGFGTRTPIPGGDGFIVVGSPNDDAIVGSDGDDLICALSGDDTVDALDGKDEVLGGAGDDILSGGGGNDVLSGGRGHDTLKGNRGIDTLRGRAGRDVLQGGRGADQLTGGDGDDILRGWNGDDSLSGNAGNDTLRGGRHFDVCSGGPGTDEVFGCEA